MKVVIATDSFKGCLSSMEAGNAIAKGIENFMEANIAVFPLSDGGEGFIESYMGDRMGRVKTIQVHDAMMHTIDSSYVILDDHKSAVMELASVCGISCINKARQDILHASTYGLGEMIQDALDEHCRNFVIGIGGSGTNDGGSGMLSALGYQLLDKQGSPIPLGAIGLSKLSTIVDTGIDERLKTCNFQIACDVENPVTGNNGCSAIFAPQKGADTNMVIAMEHWMKSYVDVMQKYAAKSDAMAKGAGAAGGAGFAFLSVLRAKLVSGIQLIWENQYMREQIANCDLVVTGEGCLDVQTVMGKAPTGVARLAKTYQKPVIAFAGTLTKDSDLCNSYGIDAFFSIQRCPCTLSEAMEKDRAYDNLVKVAEQAMRLFMLRNRH